jgi:hypothetical protein
MGVKLAMIEFKTPSWFVPTMQKTSCVNTLITAGALAVAIAPWIQPVVKAREPVPQFLFDTQCVTNGPGRSQQETLDISVGRKVYRSYFFLGPGSREVSVTCRISPEEAKFQSLSLEFGMRDNDRGSPSNSVTIYLDGVRQVSETVSPGQRVSLSIDLGNANHIAIETVCSVQNRYCDRVYFFEATLSPTSHLTPTESPNPI